MRQSRKRDPDELDGPAFAAFLNTCSQAERDQLFSTSRLEGAMLERWWRKNEYQEQPPDHILIEVYVPDVDRLIAQIKREQKLERRAKRARGGTA